jgi:hypothetical protein
MAIHVSSLRLARPDRRGLATSADPVDCLLAQRLLLLLDLRLPADDAVTIHGYFLLTLGLRLDAL